MKKNSNYVNKKCDFCGKEIDDLNQETKGKRLKSNCCYLCDKDICYSHMHIDPWATDFYQEYAFCPDCIEIAKPFLEEMHLLELENKEKKEIIDTAMKNTRDKYI